MLGVSNNVLVFEQEGRSLGDSESEQRRGEPGELGAVQPPIRA